MIREFCTTLPGLAIALYHHILKGARKRTKPWEFL